MIIEILNMGNKNEQQKKQKPIEFSSDLFINEIKSNPDKDYETIKQLGSGSYGTVYKVKSRLTGLERAMKTISKSSISNINDVAEISNEINILKSIDHPSILKIYEFYSNPEAYHIVTELGTEGDLFGEINKRGPFGESVTALIMHQVLSAVNYCHQMKIVHRDIKPENILLSKRPNEIIYRIKLCDFGTSKMFEKNEVIKNIVGSSYYIAPEVIQKKYNEKCDLWSCGVLLYILLSKKPPFNGKTDEEIMGRVKIGQYSLVGPPWNTISSEAKDLIKSLLTFNVKDRLSSEQALNHPWFEIHKVKDILDNIESSELIDKYIHNLKTFKVESLLQEAALAYLVHNFSEIPEIFNACKLFNQIDYSKDGKITADELYKVMAIKNNNPKLKSDVDLIFKNIDSNNNGYIEYEEFIRAAIDKTIFLNEQFLSFAFNYFDKDNSGEITHNELLSIFQNFTENRAQLIECVRQIMHKVDLDGDGTISMMEFGVIMAQLLNK